jgi:hypothetical protein
MTDVVIRTMASVGSPARSADLCGKACRRLVRALRGGRPPRGCPIPYSDFRYSTRSVFDRETVVKFLNIALATEIVCVLRYKRHHFMATGIHGEPVAQEILESPHGVPLFHRR